VAFGYYPYRVQREAVVHHAAVRRSRRVSVSDETADNGKVEVVRARAEVRIYSPERMDIRLYRDLAALGPAADGFWAAVLAASVNRPVYEQPRSGLSRPSASGRDCVKTRSASRPTKCRTSRSRQERFFRPRQGSNDP